LRLQETIAKTILFVTHDIDEAIKMGDLVAVVQTAAHLARLGPPTEILAAPASEFVARFVGQDRGLKRLSLLRVGDVPFQAPATARPGASAPEARRRAPAGRGAAEPRARGLADPLHYLLVGDEQNRPIGWVAAEDIPAEGQVTEARDKPGSPTVSRRTTVQDALSTMAHAG